jgi:hypothetical protein
VRLYRTLSFGNAASYLLGGLLLAFALFTGGCKELRNISGPGTLTTSAELRALSPEDAVRGHPVRLRGVVTLSSGLPNTLIVQDATGASLVDTLETPAAVDPGQEVEVEGSTGRGDDSNIIALTSIKVLGKGQLPKPLPLVDGAKIRADQALSLVEVEGVVRSAATHNGGRYTLNIAGAGTRLDAVVAIDNPDYADDVDSRVRVHGILRIVSNSKGDVVRIHLLVPTPSDIEILEAAPADPFSLPVQSIASLKQDSGVVDGGEHRVHVQGWVTDAPEGGLLLSDASGQVRVKTDQPSPLVPGSRMEVIGFPTPDGQGVLLEDAVLGNTGPVLLKDEGNHGKPENPSGLGPSAGVLPVLRSVDQIHGLTATEAKRGYPVRIRGVMTYYDAGWGFGFFQEGDSGIFVPFRASDGTKPKTKIGRSHRT